MKVFLMSNTELLREGLRHILAAAPDLAVVGTAPCRREALPLLAPHCPDLVVLDLDARSGNCAELLLITRSLGIGARLLVISDISDTKFCDLCLSLGADDVIDSSGPNDDLAAAVLAYARHLSATTRQPAGSGSPGAA